MVERPGTKSRVLLVERDPWRHECVSAFLESQGFQMVSESPEVLLVNLCRRSSEAADTVQQLRRVWPDARLLVLVNEIGAHTVFPCLVLGVNGIVSFDVSKGELVAALRAVLVGSMWVPRELLAGWVERVVKQGLRGVPLHVGPVSEPGDVFTKSQWRILQALGDELSNKEIAKLCHVSEATVKFHIGKLLRKTGAKGRRDLAHLYREMVSTTPPGPEALAFS